MKSNPFDEHTDASPIPVYITPTIGENDEISFVDLWRVIVKRKAILLISIFVSILLGGAYLYFSKPLYKASMNLLPPQQQQIQGLLVDYRDEMGVSDSLFTQELVFKAFLENLKSQGSRYEFFDNHNLLERYSESGATTDVNADRIFDVLFNERLKVLADRQDDAFVTVSFIDDDPRVAAQLLNQFIDFTNKRTADQLSSYVSAAIQAESAQVRYLIDSKLKLAEQRKLDSIVELREALRIAKKLGIHGASFYPEIAENKPVDLVVVTAQSPPYMRGIEALETEITVLESRKSDEPFVDGLRDLQERRAFLESISIDIDTLSTVKVDRPAGIPYKSEGPRKVWILMLVAMFGVIVGVLAIFFVELLANMGLRRKASGSEAL